MVTVDCWKQLIKRSYSVAVSIRAVLVCAGGDSVMQHKLIRAPIYPCSSVLPLKTLFYWLHCGVDSYIGRGEKGWVAERKGGWVGLNLKHSKVCTKWDTVYYIWSCWLIFQIPLINVSRNYIRMHTTTIKLQYKALPSYLMEVRPNGRGDARGMYIFSAL